MFDNFKLAIADLKRDLLQTVRDTKND